MASTSYSSTLNSPRNNLSSYDVFLSFRGEDTRDSFTDHLYDALKRAEIDAFKDNEEINKGEELKPEIERAIKESRASIVVLSENYATSAWCLVELCLILEQRRECNHFVLPIFYHVNPSDIRKQSETLMIENKVKLSWADYKMIRWKIALKEVADLAGMVISGPETKFLRKIVNIISDNLNRKEIYLQANLAGIQNPNYEINLLSKESCAKVVATCGVGESVKIMLANHIDNSNYKQFQYMNNPGQIISIYDESKDWRQLKEYEKYLYNSNLQNIQINKKGKIMSVCQGKWPESESWRPEYKKWLMDDDKDLEHLKQQVSGYYAEISRYLRDAHDPHKVSSQGKGSMTNKGSTLDMRTLRKQKDASKKIVLGLKFGSETRKCNVMKAVCGLEGIESIVADTKGGRLIVIGDVDPVRVATCVRKIEKAEIITVEPAYNCVDKLSQVASMCSVMQD